MVHFASPETVSHIFLNVCESHTGFQAVSVSEFFFKVKLLMLLVALQLDLIVLCRA